MVGGDGYTTDECLDTIMCAIIRLEALVKGNAQITWLPAKDLQQASTVVGTPTAKYLSQEQVSQFFQNSRVSCAAALSGSAQNGHWQLLMVDQDVNRMML